MFSHLLDKQLFSLLKILQAQILGPNTCKYDEEENIYQRYFTVLLLFCAIDDTTFLLTAVAVLNSAGSAALAVFISQCLHVLFSKAVQISRVLLSTELNTHIFNPLTCNTFIGDAAHYYFVTNIHSQST